MARPKGSKNKKSKSTTAKGKFAKQLINQVQESGRIIEIFENHGFEVTSMEQFSAIASELTAVLQRKSKRIPGSKE